MNKMKIPNKNFELNSTKFDLSSGNVALIVPKVIIIEDII